MALNRNSLCNVDRERAATRKSRHGRHATSSRLTVRSARPRTYLRRRSTRHGCTARGHNPRSASQDQSHARRVNVSTLQSPAETGRENTQAWQKAAYGSRTRLPSPMSCRPAAVPDAAVVSFPNCACPDSAVGRLGRGQHRGGRRGNLGCASALPERRAGRTLLRKCGAEPGEGIVYRLPGKNRVSRPRPGPEDRARHLGWHDRTRETSSAPTPARGDLLAALAGSRAHRAPPTSR